MTAAMAKGVGIWLAIAVAAVANGLLREKVLAPLLGTGLALPLSGVLLCLLVLLVTWVLIPVIGRHPARFFVLLGLLWVVLTLAFEFVLGHYVAGKTWREIARIFDMTTGDLFVPVLLVSALSPWLAARMRGFV